MLLFIGVSNAASIINNIEKSHINPIYTPHDPIYIIGNDNFTSDNGVIGGSGKSYDPYLIKGWDINTSTKDGITIKNVSVYFTINNCYIHGDGINNDGIVFYNVTKGVIENSNITKNRNGIIFRTQHPPFKENSNKNYIHHNNITNNTKDGIHFEHTADGYHSYNKIYRNNLKGNNQGIYMVMSAYNLIYNNNILSNNKWGVNLTMCMGGGGSNKVYHNNFLENGEKNSQACVWWTLDNDWDNGYPSGGNFWSDYDGIDNFSGQNQNISGSDNIGDAPYNITLFWEWQNYGLNPLEYDYYPLMEPYGNWPIQPFAKFTYIPSHPDPNETIIFNASWSVDYDGNITHYEWDWDNDGEYDKKHTNYTAIYSWAEYGYYPVTLKVTDNDNITDCKTKTIKVGNLPPYAQNITGPSYGRPGVEYTFCVEGIDPDRDNIYCIWEWGDGIDTGWLGPYQSGEIICASHAWQKEGTYTISVKLKDEYGHESGELLHVIIIEARPPHAQISRPKRAVYINDKVKIPFLVPVIFGDIQLWFNAYDSESGLDYIELYIDNALKETFYSIPKSWTWDEKVFFRHIIKIIAYDNAGNNAIKQKIVWKFF